MGAWNSAAFVLTGLDRAVSVPGARVTANFFPLLGVQPAIGRNFLAEEDKPGGAKAAILSHGLWQRRYGAEANIVGRDILLDGEKYAGDGMFSAWSQAEMKAFYLSLLPKVESSLEVMQLG